MLCLKIYNVCICHSKDYYGSRSTLSLNLLSIRHNPLYMFLFSAFFIICLDLQEIQLFPTNKLMLVCNMNENCDTAVLSLSSTIK